MVIKKLSTRTKNNPKFLAINILFGISTRVRRSQISFEANKWIVISLFRVRMAHLVIPGRHYQI